MWLATHFIDFTNKYTRQAQCPLFDERELYIKDVVGGGGGERIIKLPQTVGVGWVV